MHKHCCLEQEYLLLSLFLGIQDLVAAFILLLSLPCLQLHSLDEQHSFADLRFSYWMIRMHLASKDYSAALDILDAASKTQEHQSKHSAGFDVILQMVADCGKRDGREDIIDSVIPLKYAHGSKSADSLKVHVIQPQ